MGALRQRLHKRLVAADQFRRLRACYPEREGLSQDVIIVCSKTLIVADSLLTLGSASLSNRSMGFDTECNLALAADGQAEIVETIAGFRTRLLAEHLGSDEQAVAESLNQRASLIAIIDALGSGRRSLKNLPISDDEALLENLSANTVFDPERPGNAEQLLDVFGLGEKQASQAGSSGIKGNVWRFFVILRIASSTRLRTSSITAAETIIWPSWMASQKLANCGVAAIISLLRHKYASLLDICAPCI